MIARKTEQKDARGAEPARKRPRRVFARIGRIFACTAILILILLIALPFLLSLGPGRMLTEYYLQALTGEAVTIKEMKFAWSGLIVIKSLKIPRSGRQRPAFECRQISLLFHLTRPVSQQRWPSKVILTEPVGRASVSARTPNRLEQICRALGRLAVFCGRPGTTQIELRDGTFHLMKAETTALTWRRLTGVITIDRDQDTLKLALKGARLDGGKEQPVAITGAFQVSPEATGLLAQYRGNLAVESADIHAGLLTMDKAAGAFEIKIAAPLARVVQFAALFSTGAPPCRLSGKLTLNARFRAGEDKVRRFGVDMVVEEALVDVPALGAEAFKIRKATTKLGAASTRAAIWTIKDLSVDGEDGTIRGRGQVSLARPFAGDLGLQLSGQGPALVIGRWLVTRLGLDPALRLEAPGRTDMSISLDEHQLQLSGKSAFATPTFVRTTGKIPWPDPKLAVDFDVRLPREATTPGAYRFEFTGPVTKASAKSMPQGARLVWMMAFSFDAKPWTAFLSRLFPDCGVSLDGRLSGKTTLHAPDGRRLRVVMDVESPKLDMSVASALSEARLKFPLGRTQISATLTQEGAVGLHVKDFSLTSDAGTVKVAEEPSSTRQGLCLAMDATLSGRDLTASLKGLLPSKLVLGNQIKVQAEARSARPTARPASTVSTNVETDRITFSVKPGLITYDTGWKIEDAEIKGRYENRKFAVTLEPCTVGEGTLNAGLKLNIGTLPPEMEFTAKAQKIAINRHIDFLPYLIPIMTPNEGKLNGLLSGEIKLESKGMPGQDTLLKKLAGSGKIEIVKGRLEANGLTAEMLRLIKKPTRYSFKSLQALFDIDKGRIHHRMVEVDGELFDMKLVGWVSVVNGAMRYELSSDFLKQNLPENAIRILRKLTVDPFKSPFILYGTVKKPRVYVTWLEGTGLEELLVKLQEKEGSKYAMTDKDRERGWKALERFLKQIEALDDEKGTHEKKR